MAQAGRCLDDVLVTARRAAQEAGALIRKTWWTTGSEVKATKSNTLDLVTETDEKCEERVISVIRKDFPGDRIIGEESSGSSKYEPLSAEPTWTIDPIDGTTNFVHRFPMSCVIITYLENCEPCVGLIFDPIADELFWAKKGTGAFLERPNLASPLCLKVPDTKALSQAVVSMEVGYGRDEESTALVSGALAKLMRAGVRSVRMAGSTGLNMAYVAAGRLNAAFEHGDWERGKGPKIWDFAAGKLIVAEAGGVTRNLDPGGTGELDLMGRSQFSACTAELADELLALVR